MARRQLIALTALFLAAPIAAQSDESEQQPKQLTEWPKLKKTEQDKVRATCKQFRKKKTELHAPAADKIVSFGAGVAPILIPMVNDRANNVNSHLFGVLDRIVDEHHAALLAREAARHSVEWRRYLMKRLSRFRDRTMLPVLAKAAKDKDEVVTFHAALGLLALNDENGVERCLVAARSRWSETRADIATALEPARSREAADLIVKRIRNAKPTEQMAGLRLLRFLLTKQQRSVLRSYLQASDFSVKREAINTARVIHGEKPLEKLASFQAINMAKEWLNKL